MSRILPFEITDVGIETSFLPSSLGFSNMFAWIAIGSGSGGQPYVPTGTETALRNEFMRVSISHGERIAPNEILLQALFEGAQTGRVVEVGLFTAGGILFAIWSGQSIGEKIANVDFVFAQSLVIEGLDLDRISGGQVTWVAGGPSINIMIDGPFVLMSTELVRLQRRAVQTEVERFTSIINAINPRFQGA